MLRLILVGFAILLSPASASAQISIERYQQLDQRFQDVGWRLVRGNAPFCDQVIASIGLQLQDIASYGRPAIARSALGLEGDFAVQTAAQGSPSAQDGSFATNREVTRIGKLDPNAWPAEERLDPLRLKRAHDHIDAVLGEEGQIAITFADRTSAQVAPVPVCASRFVLVGDSKEARADGRRVWLGTDFPAFAYDEEVFAGVVAHELAHNLLGHTAWLNRNGRRQSNLRRTEKEADRLMPWLLANAGYDPRAAQTFIEIWGPRHGGGLFRKRSHDGWDERAEFIAAELPQIHALMADTGKADWRAHFRREIDPQEGQ